MVLPSNGHFPLQPFLTSSVGRRGNNQSINSFINQSADIGGNGPGAAI